VATVQYKVDSYDNNGMYLSSALWQYDLVVNHNSTLSKLPWYIILIIVFLTLATISVIIIFVIIHRRKKRKVMNCKVEPGKEITVDQTINPHHSSLTIDSYKYQVDLHTKQTHCADVTVTSTKLMTPENEISNNEEIKSPNEGEIGMEELPIPLSGYRAAKGSKTD